MPSPWKLVLGFFSVILCGALLLWAPFSHNPGYEVTFLQALFESTSAVCVTGLTVVPVGYTFNIFGRIVMAVLIQIGGMGIVLLGILFVLLARGRLGHGTLSLFVQAQNLMGYQSVKKTASRILLITFTIELLGMIASWFVFLENYPPLEALGYAAFHAVSAFNNAGFDILGGTDSLAAYADNIPMNLITTALVIFGGFGFIAMIDIWESRFHWSRMLLTTKITLSMTIGLLVGGTILLKITTPMTWLESWFQSVIARTAGFGTFPVAKFGESGSLIFIILMFIGASPNSTGGGVKTNTVFVAALKALSSTTEHDEDSCFHRKIPELTFTKAFTVLFFGFGVVTLGTLFVSICEPQYSLTQIITEVVSAFATVGSSTGITPSLNPASDLFLIIIMFIGRLGPITIANLLVNRQETRARYTEENVLIG